MLLNNIIVIETKEATFDEGSVDGDKFKQNSTEFEFENKDFFLIDKCRMTISSAN